MLLIGLLVIPWMGAPPEGASEAPWPGESLGPRELKEVRGSSRRSRGAHGGPRAKNHHLGNMRGRSSQKTTCFPPFLSLHVCSLDNVYIKGSSISDLNDKRLVCGISNRWVEAL